MQTENTYVETDLGNIALNPRGEYSDETSYEYLDTVSYMGGSYMCLAELTKTISGIAPAQGENMQYWQILTLPGQLTPEAVAMHDDVVSKAKQVETSRAAVELSQTEVEAAQTDVRQMRQDTQEASEEAAASRDSAAGYAQSAEISRTAAKESEDNVKAQESKVVQSVIDEGTKQIKAVSDKATEQIGAVNTAGSTQTSIIEAKGADQVKAIQKAGENALQNIGNGVDKGLLEEGKAADAKATGKAISKLTEDLSDFSDNVCWLMKGWLDNHTEDLIIQEIELNYTDGAFWNRDMHLADDKNGRHTELEVSRGQFYFLKGAINYYVRAAIVSETAENQDVSEKPHNFMLAPYDILTEYTLNEVIPIFSYGNYLKLSQFVEASKVYTPVLYLVKGVKVNETEIDLTEILQRLTNLEQDNKTLSSNVENVINEILEEKSKNSLQINILHEMRYRCPFVWKKEKINLATFTFDDARKDISDILQLFKTKGVPCNFAVPPENLSKVCNDGRTVKEVLTDAQNNLGCEILSHSLTYINQYSEDSVYQTTYIKNPIELSKNGFNVKGLIVAGGGSGGSSYQTQDFVKGVDLAFYYLQYGDLINHFDKVNAPEFHNNRKFLDKGYDDIKTYIDDFMNGELNGYSRWCNFASHGIEDGNINISDLEQIVDYCISKGLVVTTWNDVFKSNYTA